MRTLLLLAATLFATRSQAETWTPLATTAELKGAFHAQSKSENAFWEDQRNESRPTFLSGPLGSELGSFRTTVFAAPARMRFFVAGYPRSTGMRVYLRDEDTACELNLGSTLDASIAWHERIWDLPRDWQSRKVRLIVEDGSTEMPAGWVALTLPEAGSHPAWLPFARALYRNTFLMLELVWFLIPGIAAALWLPTVWFPRWFHATSAIRFASLTIVAAAIAAYAVFWIYVANPQAGAIACGLLSAASIAMIWKRRRPVPRELAILFAAVVLAAVFYHSLGFLFYTEDGPGEFAQARFHPSHMPPDNLLQYLFAWDLYNGVSVHPFLIGDVHSSDRPPLETAISLAQWPFWRMLSILVSYQLLGVGLQCLWVAAIWILLRACGVSPPTIAFALLLILFTGFAWEHSFYVWPKLLAATFCLIGIAAIPAFRGRDEPWTLQNALVAAAAFSLCLLSHAGSGFTILAVAAYLVITRQLPPLRLWLPAVALGLILLAPWRAYQMFGDPPGDALLKLHLAGSSDPNIGLGPALAQAYGKLTASQLLQNKLSNLTALFAWPGWRPHAGWRNTILNLADLSFFAFFPCAGLLNLGLLARLGLRRSSAQVRFADRILLVSLASLLVWCFLMFEPGSAVVHQGSFATILLYFLAMAMYLHAFSRTLAWTIAAVQGCVVFPVLVFLEPVILRPPGYIWNDPLDAGMAAAALLSLACLVALAIATSNRRYQSL